jgi:hypothetical protein
MRLKEGQLIIFLIDHKVYKIKYFFSNLIVVDSGKGYDMPIRKQQWIPYSPLMEELI